MIPTKNAPPMMSDARIDAICRCYLHVANNPNFPMVANHLYTHDVGDLIAEVLRLRAMEHDMQEKERVQ